MNFLKKTRPNYWSCTKFANLVRGTEKPLALTLEEWDSWAESSKRTHRIRHWLAEEGLDALQDILLFPSDVIYSFRVYIRNRFIDRSHCLTSSQLEKGSYHELDDRILYCLFDELVEFVEVELAHHTAHCHGYKFKGRSESVGIEHLDWASELRYGGDDYYLSDPNDERHGQLTPQAEAAIEIKALYLWWKYQRTKRGDPWDYDDALDRVSQYTEEDTEMLVRLVKVRNHLWT